VTQILARSETSYSMILEYMLKIGRVLIGVGICISPVTCFAKEYYDEDEKQETHVTVTKFLWILNIVTILKQYEELSSISFGIGLVFFTPLILIGVTK